ncbi:hypothetical protein JNUCC83_05330 [Vagococcus sp. JNUCC 83]
MNEADILATTYLDSCRIERFDDVENKETGLTEQNWIKIYDDVRCALSQNTRKDDLPVIEGTNSVNVTYDDQKLFIRPGIDVVKGDKLTVTQSTGHKHILFAKKPFFYPTHTEINLTGRDING